MSTGKKRKKTIFISAIIHFLIIILIIMLCIFIKIIEINKREQKEKHLINDIKTSIESTELMELSNSHEQSFGYSNDDITYDIYSNYKYHSKDYNANNNIDYNNLSNNNVDNYEDSIIDDSDCIIEIPAINLSKIVYTGKNRENHLNNYELVTAASDMKYSNGGNYIICGHASRLYGHSLNRLKELNKGIDIYIISGNKKEKYIINKVYYIDMNKTDEYCKQTNSKELTIISCAKYISKESYIVIKAVPN